MSVAEVCVFFRLELFRSGAGNGARDGVARFMGLNEKVGVCVGYDSICRQATMAWKEEWVNANWFRDEK
jgi:hypothetical protein